MAAQAAPAAAAQGGAEASADNGIGSDKVVTSPLVGTFYTASVSYTHLDVYKRQTKNDKDLK